MYNICYLHGLVIASVTADDRQTLIEPCITDDHTVSDQLWHCNYHLTHKINNHSW